MRMTQCIAVKPEKKLQKIPGEAPAKIPIGVTTALRNLGKHFQSYCDVSTKLVSEKTSLTSAAFPMR